jgi:hypothetical protein
VSETSRYRGYLLRFSHGSVDVLDPAGRLLGSFLSCSSARLFVLAKGRADA